MDELRAVADTRPGYATYPNSKAGSPNWWQRHGQQPPARPTPTARPWTGPQPLMSFGPPMILAAVDEQDDEPTAADMTEAVTMVAATGKRVWLRDGSGCIEHEPRRWWHRITRGMA